MMKYLQSSTQSDVFLSVFHSTSFCHAILSFFVLFYSQLLTFDYFDLEQRLKVVHYSIKQILFFCPSTETRLVAELLRADHSAQ